VTAHFAVLIFFRGLLQKFGHAYRSTTMSPPVHFFSHGSTMMLGEESESATYWKKCGDEALANGVKGVIMMV
jgi:aromatic ring-opening dioxygenase catalytic subunit (LigB family)